MKSFVVIGMGRFGSALATELYKLGHEVLAIDEHEELIGKVADHVTHAVVGDAKDESVMRSIGVRNFDCVVVAIADSLQDSVLTTLMLKELGAKYVICKAQSEMHMKVLQRIGADRVVFPERDMGQRLAQNLSSTNIIDFIELSKDFSIIETAAPNSWHGKSLKDLGVRSEHGLNIIAVRGAEKEKVVVSPPGSYVVKPNDVLIVVGANSALNKVRDL